MTDERFIFDKHGVPRPNRAFPEPEPKAEPEQFKGEVFEGYVVSYLLGQMSEEQAEQFEDECFAQKYWPSRIKLVEEDLIDAYLHDELSSEQRQCFEQSYLTSEGRQEQVRMAAALLRQVCEGEAISTQPVGVVGEGGLWARRMRAIWGGQAWPLRAAYAVAAVAIIVGGAWLYLSRVQPPRIVVSLKLTSTVDNRSQGVNFSSIKLPSDAEALKVDLMLPTQAAADRRYLVELENEDGDAKSLAIAAQDAQSVTVLIPASQIPRGKYALTLAVENDGTYRNYFFTVE